MAQKIYSTPNSDDFYVIPEFLEHQQCWMVWAERTDNWRLGAKPAQEKISKRLFNNLCFFVLQSY
ncbi:hypothetical protein [Spiroplasma endosymbiont of Colias croceus]|uniref:hypothetical protein n=1 Tax=Spiroplasma endosymbiont of Colias croceus TaxID=3066310 RepID=UPI0030D16971